MAQLHVTLGPEILALARTTAQTGEPIIRPLEYVFPHRGYAIIRDQFLLGDGILVAPMLEKGGRQRKVVLPPGTWRGDDSSVVTGPCDLAIDVPLARLPWYRLTAAN
jgi:alpha-glucosidase (family GH31 glycosyl hydrolase)